MSKGRPLKSDPPCAGCKKHLPPEAFYLMRSTGERRMSRCKECWLEYMRQYRAKRKETAS